MIDDRLDGSVDDEVGDVADDVIYVSDVDDADDPDDPDTWDFRAGSPHVGWASMVTGAHHVLTWGRRRTGGADGTGAG